MIENPRVSFALRGWRSACALVSCTVAWLASLGAIVGSMILYTRNGDMPLEFFRYFTSIANAITLIGAGLLYPFAVEGVRRKCFSCPRWATLFFYSGTICSTLTMLVATLFISWSDPEMAFGGYNLYLHVICPFLTITTFFLVESDSRYSLQDSVVCTTPVVAYAVTYYWKVVYIGVDRGGWEDMYHVVGLLPPIVAIALAVLMAFGIAQVIRIAYRRLYDYRLKRFARLRLADDLTEVEVRLSVLELGELIGRYEDEDFVVLPLKDISIVAERYGIRREELVEVYTRALVDTMDAQRAARAKRMGLTEK